MPSNPGRETRLRPRIVPSFALMLIFALPDYASATGMQQTLKTNGCNGCHTTTAKLVGPAWGWVAYRYKGKKNAASTVANFIVDGGTGYWEAWTSGIPMPSHHNLSKTRAETIAKWILSQPPIKPPKP